MLRLCRSHRRRTVEFYWTSVAIQQKIAPHYAQFTAFNNSYKTEGGKRFFFGWIHTVLNRINPLLFFRMGVSFTVIWNLENFSDYIKNLK